MKGYKGKLGLIVLIVVLVGSLSSCDKGPTKEELQAELTATQMQLDEYIEENIKLEGQIKTLNGEEISATGLSNIPDTVSGSNSLKAVGGKLLFDSALEYKNAVQIANTGQISLVDGVTIQPSDNWVIQFEGTSTKFSHPSGITGSIKITKIDEAFKADVVDKEMLEPFLESIPNTGISKSMIYIDDTARGMMADITTLTNNKPTIIKCGLAGRSDKAMVFIFQYEGDKDATKNEIITNLLKSMKFRSMEVRIE